MTDPPSSPPVTPDWAEFCSTVRCSNHCLVASDVAGDAVAQAIDRTIAVRTDDGGCDSVFEPSGMN